MIYKEEVRDLFTVPQGYMLAQCISADLAMAAGIAVKFNEIYNMKNKIKKRYDDFELEIGMALCIDNVYNLITKKYGFDIPEYNDLKNCLNDMKDDMEYYGRTKLAIPKISCGLDKLEWEKVKELIIQVFRNTDIEVLVCLNPEEYKIKTEINYDYNKEECENCDNSKMAINNLKINLSDEEIENFRKLYKEISTIFGGTSNGI